MKSHAKILLSRLRQFVGSSCLHYAIMLLSTATKTPSAMAKLEPHIENILYLAIVPILLLTDEEVRVFREEPMDYIRNLDNLTEMLVCPKHQIKALLRRLTGFVRRRRLSLIPGEDDPEIK